MFNCQICFKASKKRYSLIINGRRVTYQNTVIDSTNQKKFITSHGWEIKKELAVCIDCYEKHANTPITMDSDEIIMKNIHTH